MAVVFARLSRHPLDLGEHVAAVTRPHYGAVATFAGIVRDHDPDVVGRVVSLDYSAHPDTDRVLVELAHRFDGDHMLAVSHRVGHLAVGDLALVAAVASAHRAEAFEACRGLVEAVKAEAPIWKRQQLADGSHTWVGL